MSHNSPFGGPSPDPLESDIADDAAFDDAPAGRRVGRGILIGALGVAVLGGGALGFLWLSSAPGGETSVAAAPAFGSNPSATVGPLIRTDNAAFGGRDIFASTVGPDDAAVATGAGSTASATTTASLGTVIAAGNSGASGSSGSSGGGVTVPSASAGGQQSTAPKPSTQPTAAVPTPSRSTAPSWVKPIVSFVGAITGENGAGDFLAGDTTKVVATGGVGLGGGHVLVPSGGLVPATSTIYTAVGNVEWRDMTADEKEACQDSISKAADTEAAAKISRETRNCTMIETSVYRALLTPSDEPSGTARSGWVVDAKGDLPDAAVGKTTGTVRLIGRNGDTFYLQVDRQPYVSLKAGEAVPGTPLTFVGMGFDAIDRDDVAVFSANSASYFTIPGAGETAGVSF